MSDSAPLDKQQTSGSKMQAPDTALRVQGSMIKPVVVDSVLVSPPQTSVASDSGVSQLPPNGQPLTPAPVVPVSAPSSVSPHKEAGPLPVVAPVAESPKVVEVIKPSTPEISLPPEVKEVVQISEDAKPIKIDAQLQKVGVAAAGASVPVVHTPTGDVKLPMTYADALAKEKKTKFWEAVHWFAAFVVYQWRKLDPSLKD